MFRGSRGSRGTLRTKFQGTGGSHEVNGEVWWISWWFIRHICLYICDLHSFFSCGWADVRAGLGQYLNIITNMLARKWLGSALSSLRIQARKHDLENKTFFPSRYESLEGAVCNCIGYWMYHIARIARGDIWWSPWRRLKTCELKGWERMNWSKAWRSWRLQKFIKICTEGDREAKSILGQRQEASEEEHDEKCLVLHLSGGGGGGQRWQYVTRNMQ